MNAELRHIRAFLAVARWASFTRAASALNVSQPALTVQIRQLEQALGVRLFDRNNRRVALTRAGREFVAPLERVILDVDLIGSRARDLSTQRAGVVTVAALPSVTAGVLPRAIRLLSDRHPSLVVRVRDAVGGRVVDLVKAGDVDFGVSSLLRPDPELVGEPLFTDRLCAFAPAGHPLARRRFVTLRELTAHPLILTTPDSSVRQLVERALDERRLPANVVQETTYMTSAIGMVSAGLGIAVLPESAWAPARGLGPHAIAIRHPTLKREIGILRRAERSLSPAAATLVDALKKIRTAGRRV